MKEPPQTPYDSLKCIEIQMPGIDPEDIIVSRVGNILTIEAHENPLDIVGDKYYEQYNLSSKVIVDSVYYYDPLLKIILRLGAVSTHTQTYSVGDLRNGESNGNRSNT